MQGTVLLPSLNRPHLVKRFFEDYLATKATVPGMLLVDHTDPKKDEYLKLDLPQGWNLILTQGVTMGDKVREVWDQIVNLDWVMILNDDHRPRTEGWDQKILAKVTATNLVFTNDNYVFPNRICGAICFSGGFLRALGYMFLPGMQHLFSDDLWQLLCARSRCAVALQEVVVEHDHAYKDKTQQDSTFFKVNGEKGLNETGQGDGGFWPEDKKVFETWLNTGQAEKDIQKVIDIQPKQGLMISTPSHDGNVNIGYAVGLADIAGFMATNNVYFEMARVVGSSLIPHARNALADMFLKSRCQKMLFVDADQGFDKNAVLHLFNSPRRIVAGITPHKRFPINLNFEPLKEDEKYFQQLTNKGMQEFVEMAKAKADGRGEIEVNRSGTGFMMIDRSVFEIMRDFFRKEEQRIKDFKERIETLCPDVYIEYADIISGYLNYKFQYEPFDDRPDQTQDEYFAMGGFGGRFRGEDWRFTELAKKLNIPIYINANAFVTHHGSFQFTA